MNVEDIIFEYINKKTKIIGETKIEKLNYNYLDSGEIDSMEMVEMIVYLENKLNIKFNANELQSNEFRTVGGLIDIIKKCISRDSN